MTPHCTDVRLLTRPDPGWWRVGWVEQNRDADDLIFDALCTLVWLRLQCMAWVPEWN